jgi:hypothetical protein
MEHFLHLFRAFLSLHFINVVFSNGIACVIRQMTLCLAFTRIVHVELCLPNVLRCSSVPVKCGMM